MKPIEIAIDRFLDAILLVEEEEVLALRIRFANMLRINLEELSARVNEAELVKAVALKKMNKKQIDLFLSNDTYLPIIHDVRNIISYMRLLGEID